MWHKFASLALTVGAFVATKAIPAGVVLTLGALSIPVAPVVAAALTAGAAIAVNPSEASSILSNIVNKVTRGNLGAAPADNSVAIASQAALTKGFPNNSK